jgi:ribosome-associated protein
MARYHSSAMRDEIPSKTKKKQEMHELQKLGAALVGLSDAHFGNLALPEDLAHAVREARRMTGHEAKRRQMQYIGRLMREEGDAASIRSRLDVWNGTSVEETARLHLLERWRTRLLADDAALADLLAAHPGVDAQRLRTLIRNTKREAEAGKPPKSFRELFQELREIIQTQAR